MASEVELEGVSASSQVGGIEAIESCSSSAGSVTCARSSEVCIFCFEPAEYRVKSSNGQQAILVLPHAVPKLPAGDPARHDGSYASFLARTSHFRAAGSRSRCVGAVPAGRVVRRRLLRAQPRLRRYSALTRRYSERDRGGGCGGGTLMHGHTRLGLQHEPGNMY